MITIHEVGPWIIVREAGKAETTGKRLVLARCGCGREQVVQFGNIKSGRSRQCISCAKRDRPSNRRTHGEALKTPEYFAWRGLRERCQKPENGSYERYGARGITVCERWLGRNGYANFLADMGRRPGPGYSVDRKDNDGPYSPTNCRWSTRQEQMRNTSRSVRLTIGDETLSLPEWTERSEFAYHTIWRRLRAGWSPREAVFGR
jgi:hypothetical protein